MVNSVGTSLLINSLSAFGVTICGGGGLVTIGGSGLTSTSGTTNLSATNTTSLTASGLITASNGFTSTGSTTLGASTIGIITGTSASFSGLLTASNGFTSTGTTILSTTTTGALNSTTGTFSSTLGVTGLASFLSAGISVTGTSTLAVTNTGTLNSSTGTFSGLLSANNGLTINTGTLTGITATFSGLLTASAGLTSTASTTNLGSTNIGAATISGIVNVTNTTVSTNPTSGALTVAGDIATNGTLAIANKLKLHGATSGYTALQGASVAGNNTITLPSAPPVVNNAFLVSDTFGVLTYINSGDAVFPTFTFIGGQSQTNQDITNLLYLSGPFNIGVQVDIVATTYLTEYFMLYGVLSLNGPTGWNMTTTSIAGDVTGVTFDITGTGQIRYSSPSYAGFTSLTITWTRILPTVPAINVNSGTNTTSAVPSTGALFNVNGSTFTDSSTSTSGTLANFYGSYIGRPNISASNTSVTTTNAYTMYLLGTPTAGINETITNAYTLFVASGLSVFNGGLTATTGSYSGNVNMNSNIINNIGTPLVSSDSATKGYVDTLFQGISTKTSVLAATITAGTLSTSFVVGSVIDGVTLALNNRILIKNQTNQIENGIYTVNAISNPTRASDFSSGQFASGTYVFVEQGTVNSNSGFICTSLDGFDTINTHNLTFVQFSGAGSFVSGVGLTQTGNVIDVDASQTQITQVGTLLSLAVNNGVAINGSTSGTTSVTVPAVAGTFNFVLPLTSGTSGQVLLSGGGGSSPMTWVSTNGTGTVVLTTSPTLVTPNIGVANGTSLQLSGLTASSAVATDGSKNLISVTNTGTGDNVLATSPTLVTPNLGAASCTSLSTSGQITSTYNSGAPFVVANSTVVTNLNANFLNGNTFAIPGAIGGITPSTGTFTTITGVTGTYSSTLGVTGLATFLGGLTSTAGVTTLGSSTIGVITGTSATFSGLLTANGGLTSTAGTTSLGTTTISSTVDMNTNRINNLGNPVADTDATNKGSVNTLLNALNAKGSVVVATTVAGTLASSFTAGSVIDTVTLVLGDRILIKDQAIGSENGIYVVTAGTPTRALDFALGTSAAGAYTVVTRGSAANIDSLFLVSNVAGSAVVGTNALTFGQISGHAITAGTGLTLSAYTLSVNASQTQITSVGTLTSLTVSGNTTTGTLTIGSTNYNPNTSDIPTQLSFTGANNQAAPANITGLLFAYTSVRSFIVQMAVTVIATTNLYSQYELKGVQHASGWYFIIDNIGDDVLITLSITSAGQIQYTSPNYTGFTSLTFKFKGSSITL